MFPRGQPRRPLEFRRALAGQFLAGRSLPEGASQPSARHALGAPSVASLAEAVSGDNLCSRWKGWSTQPARVPQKAHSLFRGSYAGPSYDFPCFPGLDTCNGRSTQVDNCLNSSHYDYRATGPDFCPPLQGECRRFDPVSAHQIQTLSAPCKGTVFQRVQIPSGIFRSSR